MSACPKKDVLAIANAVEQLVSALKNIDVEIYTIHFTPESFQKLEYQLLQHLDSKKFDRDLIGKQPIRYLNSEICGVTLICNHK